MNFQSLSVLATLLRHQSTIHQNKITRTIINRVRSRSRSIPLYSFTLPVVLNSISFFWPNSVCLRKRRKPIIHALNIRSHTNGWYQRMKIGKCVAQKRSRVYSKLASSVIYPYHCRQMKQFSSADCRLRIWIKIMNNSVENYNSNRQDDTTVLGPSERRHREWMRNEIDLGNTMDDRAIAYKMEEVLEWANAKPKANMNVTKWEKNTRARARSLARLRTRHKEEDRERERDEKSNEKIISNLSNCYCLWFSMWV